MEGSGARRGLISSGRGRELLRPPGATSRWAAARPSALPGAAGRWARPGAPPGGLEERNSRCGETLAKRPGTQCQDLRRGEPLASQARGTRRLVMARTAVAGAAHERSLRRFLRGNTWGLKWGRAPGVFRHGLLPPFSWVYVVFIFCWPMCTLDFAC